MPYFELNKDEISFPPAYFADIDGLLAAGGDMSIERLLLAYNSGIYYWHHPLKHIKWWSPDPRTILFLDTFELPEKRFASLLEEFSVRMDTDFEKVLRSCQQVYNLHDRMNHNWLTERMFRTFMELFNQGYAHSFEVWKDAELVGGVFGVAIGKFFFGEYLFSFQQASDELAVLYTIKTLREKGFGLMDMQKETVFFNGMAYDELARIAYVDICKENAGKFAHEPIQI